MRLRELHGWDLTTTEARDLQLELASRVVLKGSPRSPRLIAGADVAYLRRSKRLAAALLLLRRPPKPEDEWETVEEVQLDGPATFPYVPGLLSFREAPIVLECFRRLRTKPDLVLIDGQGIAHPRGFGLACHLGLWLGISTIGCAKSRLIGKYREPGPRKGRWTRLHHGGKAVGGVLRTRDHVKPLFVSPGYGVGIAPAVRLALLCTGRYRIPEPTRRAHQAAEEHKRNVEARS